MPRTSTKIGQTRYGILNHPNTMMMSDEGAGILEDILNKTRQEDLAMYAYNDFYCYAILDIVDKYMSTLHTKVTKKAYADAYPVLEALARFLTITDDWYNNDDGERVILTDKTFGALAIALFKGLDKQQQLNSRNYPDLGSLMKTIVKWGDLMGGTHDLDYHLYIKHLGERLFKDKTTEELLLERVRQREWIQTLPEEEQRDARAELRKEDNWWERGEDNWRQYPLTTVWKEYKRQLAGNVDDDTDG